jgi:monovalent cation:H+ antiporter-2, CPA2 family
MLDVHKVPYVAIDRDPDRVAQQRKAGAPVYFGDMTRMELLRRLHLETARESQDPVRDTDCHPTTDK